MKCTGFGCLLLVGYLNVVLKFKLYADITELGET